MDVSFVFFDIGVNRTRMRGLSFSQNLSFTSRRRRSRLHGRAARGSGITDETIRRSRYPREMRFTVFAVVLRLRHMVSGTGFCERDATTRANGVFGQDRIATRPTQGRLGLVEVRIDADATVEDEQFSVPVFLSVFDFFEVV